MHNPMAMGKHVLVWMDMEMSGLDPKVDRPLEVALMLTDWSLQELKEGPDLVVHQPAEVLDAMDEWNRDHHHASGLTARVKESDIDESRAQALMMGFLTEHLSKGQGILAGNSIHQDRRFVRAYFPELDEFLHYRMVDVSAVKELVKHWFPDVYKHAPRKGEKHRALDDVRESINELRYYRQTVFVNPPPTDPAPNTPQDDVTSG